MKNVVIILICLMAMSWMGGSLAEAESGFIAKIKYISQFPQVKLVCKDAAAVNQKASVTDLWVWLAGRWEFKYVPSPLVHLEDQIDEFLIDLYIQPKKEATIEVIMFQFEDRGGWIQFQNALTDERFRLPKSEISRLRVSVLERVLKESIAASQKKIDDLVGAARKIKVSYSLFMERNGVRYHSLSGDTPSHCAILRSADAIEDGILEAKVWFGFSNSIHLVCLRSRQRGAFFKGEAADAIWFTLTRLERDSDGDKRKRIQFSAFHEMAHLIAYRWKLDQHPKWTAWHKEIKDSGDKGEKFFRKINEGNFLSCFQPDAVSVGHAQDNADEFFATCMNTLHGEPSKSWTAEEKALLSKSYAILDEIFEEKNIKAPVREMLKRKLGE